MYFECMLSINTIDVSTSNNQKGRNCATFISFQGDLLPVNLFMGVIILPCISIHSRVLYVGRENKELPNNEAKHVLLVLHLNANTSYRCFAVVLNLSLGFDKSAYTLLCAAAYNLSLQLI